MPVLRKASNRYAAMKLNTPFFLYSTAQEFYKLALQRCEQIFKDDFENDTRLYLKIVPPAINLSFGVELMLKAAHLHHSQSHPFIHELKKLFFKLPNFVQNEIIEAFSSLKSEPKRFPFLRYVLAEVKDQQPQRPFFASATEEMTYELTCHDTSFVRWRYLSDFPKKDEESIVFNFAFMIRFSEACSIYCRSKFPTLP